MRFCNRKDAAPAQVPRKGIEAFAGSSRRNLARTTANWLETALTERCLTIWAK